MKQVLVITLLTGALLNVVMFAFAVRPTTERQLGFMLLIAITLGLTLLSPFLVLAWWRSHKWRSFLPFVAAAFSLVLTFPSARVGGVVRDRLFRSRLAQYEEVVGQIHSGAIPIEGGLQRVELPARYARLAVATLAERDSTGTITVEFLIGGGFPVKHTGYLYRSAGTLKAWRHARRWPHSRQLQGKWYAVSD